MDQKPEFPVFPMYFRGLLLLSGMYTFAWSAFYKWFGSSLLPWLSMDEGVTLDLNSNWFGSFGLIVGILIFISAFYPVSWFKVMIAGLTGKVLMAIWFAVFFIPTLGWNKRTGFELFFNEIFWLIPLGIILWRAKKVKTYLSEKE